MIMSDRRCSLRPAVDINMSLTDEMFTRLETQTIISFIYQELSANFPWLIQIHIRPANDIIA